MIFGTMESYVPLPSARGRILSFTSRLPSRLRTTFPIYSFMNFLCSSLSNTALVVIVNLKFLPVLFCLSSAYITISFTTSKFIRGSPPKKSTSRFRLAPDLSMRKSIALFPTDAGISVLFTPKSPVDAKQYLHLRLQSCAI